MLAHQRLSVAQLAIIFFRMLNYRNERTIFGLTGDQVQQALSRVCARYVIIPIRGAFDIIMHTMGVAFLLRFGLEVAGSERLFTSNLGQLSRLLTDPLLSSVWMWMAGFQDIRPDTYHAVPMIFAIAVWVVRPTLHDRITWLADHLEGRSLEKLFHEKEVRTAPRWKSRLRRREELLQTEYESREELEARLAVTATTRTAGPAIDTSGEHRLGHIGFDSETRLQIIGRYELLQELGRGPMGVVYKAYDLQIGRTVVVKLLNTDGMDEEELHLKKQRLLKEARAAGKLVHAGLVAVFDVSEDEHGNPYIVMEHVEGETLEDALNPRFGLSHGQAPLNLQQRLDVAIEITQAVEYAHSRGIIHRDLKPSNVLLTPDGHAKIVDFGIARLIEYHRVKSPGKSGVGDEDDVVPGTPEFVAPELLSGMSAGRASDIFSLGVMLYWIFTGELPFSGRTVTEITYNVANIAPPPVRQLNWALPAELDALLQRCLAKDPVARYSSASELAAELLALRYVRLAQQSSQLAAQQNPPRAKAG
jgi:tRNA A-37 threonylcarbamoyl transferase component Bud32